MVSRKRGREEMEAAGPEPASEPTMLQKLRGTWELANLMQYIFLFGKALKIDEDLDIDDLEQECLKPEKSKVLNDIGLALLKFVSSHRGLTPELFDEYTRRQYVAKAPQRNPFGEEEEPEKFVDFDVFLKLKVLVQLSQWTLVNPDRLRERMPEVKENEQTQWRIEETGWDRQEHSYFVLDDNRLYRRTDPPPPPPAPVAKAKPKSTSKKGRAAARASRRNKTVEVDDIAEDADVDSEAGHAEETEKPVDDNTFGGRKWECIAVTLDEYRDFLSSIQKSRDANEKALYARITETALPEIEKVEASHMRKKQKQERELLNMQKLAGAKRSSRLEAKFEREKQDQEAAEAERKRKDDLAAAKRDQERQKSMEAARESRMMTREQRLKDREFKRVLHEEELANLSEENKKIEAGESQRSERHLKAAMEKKKKDLAALQEEEDWMFDCAKCGVYGNNLDDGSPSIACEKCNVWQHTACLGFSQEEAGKDDFHFICRDCKRREEDAKKPKIPTLKFHLGSSSSPPQSQSKPVQPATNGVVTNGVKRKSGEAGLPPMRKFKQSKYQHAPPVTGVAGGYQPIPPKVNGAMHDKVMNGPQLSPQGQLKPASPADSKSHSGGTGFSPKPPGHTYPGGPPIQSQPSFGSFQGSPNASNYNGGNQGKATESEKNDHKPNFHSSNPPYSAQNHQPYPYTYPYPAGSPSSRGSYQAYTNGSPYQPPPYNYQQQGTSFSPNGAHPSYQPYKAYGQQYGPPANAVPPHFSPPNSTPSQKLPPYTQSPAKLPPYESNPAPQRPSNGSQLSESSSSYIAPAHPTPHNQARPASSHVPTPPVLTPGPPTHPALPNGTTTHPPTLPAATPSPIKHPSPPTSFTHHPQPATSPITNQPPLHPTTNAPTTSPGFSPQKHSPPPPQPLSASHPLSAPVQPFSAQANHQSSAALPPAPKLLPTSPTLTSPPAVVVGPAKAVDGLALADDAKTTAAPVLVPGQVVKEGISPVKGGGGGGAV